MKDEPQGDSTTHPPEYLILIVNIVNIKKTDTTNAGKDVKQWKLLHTAGGHVKWHNHSGKKPGSFLKN